MPHSLHRNFNVLHEKPKVLRFYKAELKTPEQRKHSKIQLGIQKFSEIRVVPKKRKQISEKKHKKRHRAGRRRRQQQKTKNLSKFQCHKFYIVHTHTSFMYTKWHSGEEKRSSTLSLSAWQFFPILVNTKNLFLILAKIFSSTWS